MARAAATIDLPVSADQVWALIGGFGSLPDRLPYIPQSELSEGGRVRHLADPHGAAIVERLITFDHPGRSYSYAIVEAPFPVTEYLSTLRVKDADAGKSSRVEWSGQFTPKDVSDDEASTLFHGIYEDGLKALGKRLASKT
ncbi:SRPBCC family protein [Inquilinus sp. YAF38]|uniref:SRPBCC family protein n=1 Tax=Inquilinus sp. YAF38 TaxID=3233084 RepID=UPI003F8ECAFC